MGNSNNNNNNNINYNNIIMPITNSTTSHYSILGHLFPTVAATTNLELDQNLVAAGIEVDLLVSGNGTPNPGNSGPKNHSPNHPNNYNHGYNNNNNNNNTFY
jgi:hypothetical protein